MKQREKNLRTWLMGSVSGVSSAVITISSIYSDVFHWVQHNSSSSFHTFALSGHEKVENWHWTLWYPIPLCSCISVSNSSRTLPSRCISRSCKELSCLSNTWLLGATIADENRETERRLATAVATIAVWLFFKWESPKFSNNFLKTRPTVLHPLLLLLLLSPFALFQFSITTIQSQTCERNPRTQNLSEKTPWNTSEVAERAWRGRRMDSARVASVALNMKATFPMRSELMKFPSLQKPSSCWPFSTF